MNTSFIPKISFIVVTKDRTSDLVRLIRSIVKIPFSSEVILLDQSSAGNFENNAKALLEFVKCNTSFIHISDTSKSISEARNEGIGQASGEYIAFPDDDCEYPNGCVELALDYLKNTDFISGQYIDWDGTRTYFPTKRVALRPENVFGKASTITIFMARKLARQTLFDARLGPGNPIRHGEDVDFAMRCVRNSRRAFYNPNLIVFHKVRRESIDSKESRKSKSMAEGYIYAKNSHNPRLRFKFLAKLGLSLLKADFVKAKCLAYGAKIQLSEERKPVFVESSENMSNLLYLSGAPRVSTKDSSVLAGPRAHVLGVIGAFKTSGWHVSQFIVGDNSRKSFQDENAESRLRDSKLVRAGADIVRVTFGVLNGLRASRKYKGMDLVYERFAVFQMLGYFFARKSTPWILETNGIIHLEAKNDRKSIYFSGVAKFLEKKAYKSCTYLVSVSANLKEEIARTMGIDPLKILLVPNGVDIEKFKGTAQPDRANPTVGFVGNVIAWQGLDVLLKAVAAARLRGVNYKVRIVGEGPERKNLETLAAELGLNEVVEFTGSVPWSAVPSEIEKFSLCYSGQVPLQMGKMYHSPLKIYEYMAMSRPVVASDFDDARSTVGESESGYLFSPGSVEDLTGILLKAFAECDSWPEMGQRARTHIVNHHSWTARVEYMLSEVRRLEALKHA